MPSEARLMDGREIKSISYGQDCQIGYIVGQQQGITKITVYYEYGQMAGVPWFEVWKDKELLARVNAAHVTEVIYK